MKGIDIFLTIIYFVCNIPVGLLPALVYWLQLRQTSGEVNLFEESQQSVPKLLFDLIEGPFRKTVPPWGLSP